MDQSELLTLLGGLYDKLVSDVAAKVAARDQEDLGNAIDAHIHNLDDKIEDWMKHNLRDKVMDMLSMDDVDDQISNWMSNNFDINDYNVDDAIESWADNNMDDKIQEAINNLTFSVTVS
jgi:hypothetical protein